ncbi:bifunctional diguanylate cyclase/phosphodiesterase [Colwellia psychrerythraea]|uniref:Diguanylate cyclase with PAS/PAC sensor n=1 Tax=Colwellia psychrerythraea TaxID=28229 RepID=A0A099KAR1_COLPS|nr:sensor domain-containing diguanylate cyclase [Colwellia psychrerythraea]KGJ87395.1 diguanylate cyclase with PAS/PAC sensor [Colwellia psychrerythraea]
MKEKELPLEKSLYRLFEITPVPIALSFPDGKLEYVNPALKRMLGYEGDEIYSNEVTITHLDDIHVNAGIRKKLTQNPFVPMQIEKRYQHKLGHTVFVQLNIVAQADNDNLIKRYISQLIDLTTIKKSDAAEILLNHLVNKSNDAIYVVEPEYGQILNCNQLAHQRLGYNKDELLKLSVSDLNSKFDIKAKWNEHSKQIKLAGNIVIESTHTRKDGTKLPIEASISFIEFNQTGYLLAIVRDISRRKQKELEALELANLDPLTKLPNRRILENKLDILFKKAKEKNTLIAFFFIDLDHFKLINDSHGHSVGDEILVGTANRLKHCIRGSDIVTRMGGDEFLVVISGVKEHSSIKVMADKLQEEFTSPFKVQAHLIAVKASIGVSVYSNNNGEAHTLIQLADEAMYEAKKELGTSIYYI